MQLSGQGVCYNRQLLDGRVFLGYVVRCVAADVLAAHLEANTLQVQDVDRLTNKTSSLCLQMVKT